MLRFATLAAALMATTAFASTAEAQGGGAFFATWLAHAGQKQAHDRWVESHGGAPHESHCDKKKERELAAIRAEEAAEAAAQAAEAKRARALALQRREAERAAAAKRAQVAALEQKKAAAAKLATETPRAPKPAPAMIDSAPKSDQLPVAPGSPANITTASLKATTADQPSSSSATNTAATSDVCRRYSPAADGLIDVPCK